MDILPNRLTEGGYTVGTITMILGSIAITMICHIIARVCPAYVTGTIFSLVSVVLLAVLKNLPS